MKKILFLLVFLFFNNSYSQEEATGDLSYILSDMQSDWSVGNGCFQTWPTVANVYGGLETNQNTLQVMDCLIQVFGDVTINGVVVPVDGNAEIILDGIDSIFYSCESSKIKVYSETLDVDEPINVIEADLKIFPNPFYDQFTIISETILELELFDINGRVVIFRKQVTHTRFTMRISGISNGIYFLNTYHEGGIVKTNQLIKN